MNYSSIIRKKSKNVIASETEWSEAISRFTGSYEIASPTTRGKLSFLPHFSQ